MHIPKSIFWGYPYCEEVLRSVSILYTCSVTPFPGRRVAGQHGIKKGVSLYSCTLDSRGVHCSWPKISFCYRRIGSLLSRTPSLGAVFIKVSLRWHVDSRPSSSIHNYSHLNFDTRETTMQTLTFMKLCLGVFFAIFLLASVIQTTPVQ